MTDSDDLSKRIRQQLDRQLFDAYTDSASTVTTNSDDNLTFDNFIEARNRLMGMASRPSVAILNKPIIETVYLTITKTAVRTWKERFLSWPWRPWQKLRIWQEPDPNVYVTKDAIICHPAIAQKLREQVADETPTNRH